MSLMSSRRILEAFGLHLRRVRNAAEVSTRALAVEVGIDHSIITRIEKGVWMPTDEQEQILRDWMVHQSKPPLPLGDG